jgi:hypothetical protein
MLTDRPSTRKTCQTLLLVLLPAALQAQVSYSFEETTAPYEPLISATPCTFDIDGFDRINELDGELFQLFGVNFPIGDAHPLHVGDNGFVRVDNDSSLIIVDGLFTTLEPHDQNSEVRYGVSGPSGARKLTVEWHRWHLSNGPADNFASWQVSMEQATGIITIHIGPNSGGGTLFNSNTGPNCGIFYSPSDFSGCYEKIWVEGSPDAIAVDSTANFDFDALLGFPEAGAKYVFTPRFTVTGVEQAPLLPAPQLITTGTGISLHWPGATAPMEMLIVDATGKAVHQATAPDDTWDFDVRNLSGGVYLLRARSGQKQFTGRFARP